MNRREILKAGAALASGGVAGAAETRKSKPQERVCLFTDHLDDFGYSYAEVASMLKQLGFAGPDLTVRAGGLVLPERVAEDLPRAAAVFREHGLSIPMISTGITSTRDPAARPTLAAMGRLGIRYYKLGYYHYDDAAQWRAQLEKTRADLEGLIRLGQEAGVQAGIHNHAGPTVGGALWDGWELLQPLDPRWVGFYFDAGQATIEGTNHAWKLNFHRVSERLKMVAVKDFYWEKSGGQWRTRWCPLGEGMVRWPEFFKSLAGVAEKDLKFLRAQLTEAFGS
jgi:L-ribulose-5-phosphate 3-epimerase